MAPTEPSPLTWTVRFKNGKNTTILHVDPSQSLSSVKSELLNALRQTNSSTGKLNGSTIPDQTDELLLARPIDSANLDKGWTRLDEADMLEEGPVAKKRKTGEKGQGNNKSADTNFKTLGLKDGAVMAFKFAHEEDEDEGLGLEDENWNVELPVYEDALAASIMNGEESP